jgi:hypothetical protein
VVVPFGDRFGVPSGQTVAAKPSFCSSTTRRMSSVSVTAACPAFGAVFTESSDVESSPAKTRR